MIVRLKSGRLVDLDIVKTMLQQNCRGLPQDCLQQWGWSREEAAEIIAKLGGGGR